MPPPVNPVTVERNAGSSVLRNYSPHGAAKAEFSKDVLNDSCLTQEVEDACDHRGDDSELQQALDKSRTQHEYNNRARSDDYNCGHRVDILQIFHGGYLLRCRNYKACLRISLSIIADFGDMRSQTVLQDI